MIKPEDIQVEFSRGQDIKYDKVEARLILSNIRTVSKIESQYIKYDNLVEKELQVAKKLLWDHVYGDLHRDVQNLLNDFERMTVLSDITPVAHNLIESKFHDLLKKLQNPFTTQFPPQGE